jgi:branched-chain amino acid aminotransferase
MIPHLSVTKVSRSRLDQVNFDSLGFGDQFSDHMFSMFYRDGAWRQPEILPYGPVPVEPANATLHYGQAVFEGLKAFMGNDGVVRVFRPNMNLERLRASCERLCIPMVEESVFYDAIEALIQLDHRWIPRKRGQALYVRPLIISDEGHLEVRPSKSFRLILMTAPVRAYFDEDADAVNLKVEEQCTRAAPGGMGYAKTAGNYAASLFPGEQARAEGFAQVLWLDGVEHRYVEEVGAMNIFFRIDDTIITPVLQGTILPGVTRASVIQLLEDAGHRIEERRIGIDEVVDAVHAGALQEAFGAGTAAIISPVGGIAYKGELLRINEGAAGQVTRSLYDELTGIQLGEVADRHGWNRLIHLDSEQDVKRAATAK